MRLGRVKRHRTGWNGPWSRRPWRYRAGRWVEGLSRPDRWDIGRSGWIWRRRLIGRICHVGGGRSRRNASRAARGRRMRYIRAARGWHRQIRLIWGSEYRKGTRLVIEGRQTGTAAERGQSHRADDGDCGGRASRAQAEPGPPALLPTALIKQCIGGEPQRGFVGAHMLA